MALKAALAVEAAVRANGAVPATVAVQGGVPMVGLSGDALERLARAGAAVAKCSTRELPLVMARRQDGATTVAATSRLAALCGISVFVTGGAGGVHRGGEVSMDVSADLVELRDSPLVVVCAGVKSILDIGRTLEVLYSIHCPSILFSVRAQHFAHRTQVARASSLARACCAPQYLETMGVCVAAYQTDEFPAFFSPTSGLRAPARFDRPAEVAQHFLAARALGLRAATLLAVPNPRPADAAPVEAAIHGFDGLQPPCVLSIPRFVYVV